MKIRMNVPSINAHRNLGRVGTRQARASQRLSSGYRINTAADDAAGLAISEKMRAQIRGLDKAVMNTENGFNMLQVADGGLQAIHDMIHRIRELAVYAANDTNEPSDREKIDREIRQLVQGIDDIARGTQFNRKNLLDGTFSRWTFDRFEEILTRGYSRIPDSVHERSPQAPQTVDVSIPPASPPTGYPVQYRQADNVASPNVNTVGELDLDVPPLGLPFPIELNYDGFATLGNDIVIQGPGSVRILGVPSNVRILIIGPAEVEINDNEGTVELRNVNDAVINNNMDTGNIRIVGDYATVTDNEGNVTIIGNDATVTGNEGSVEIYGDNASLENLQDGVAHITGNNAGVGVNRAITNAGHLAIYGDDSVVASNSGRLRIADIDGVLGGTGGAVGTNTGYVRSLNNNTVITNNSGSVWFDGSDSSIGTNAAARIVYFSGDSVNGTVTTNNGTVSFRGQGTATVTTNNPQGRVHVGYGYTHANIHTNSGSLQTSSTNVTITNNIGNGTAYILKPPPSATIVTIRGLDVMENDIITFINGLTGVADNLIEQGHELIRDFFDEIEDAVNATGTPEDNVSAKTAELLANLLTVFDNVVDPLVIQTAVEQMTESLIAGINPGTVTVHNNTADAEVVVNRPGTDPSVEFILNANTGLVSTNTAYTTINGNSGGGRVYVTHGELLTVNSSTGHIDIWSEVEAARFTTGTLHGTTTVRGGEPNRVTRNGFDWVNVAFGAQFNLTNGASERVNTNSGTINSMDSIIDVITNNGAISGCNSEIGINFNNRDVFASNNTIVEIIASNTAARVYAYDHSEVYIGANSGRLSLNLNSHATVATNNAGGNIFVYNGSTADIDSNHGNVFVAPGYGDEPSSATVSRNELTGFIEIERQPFPSPYPEGSSVAVTDNFGRIRNKSFGHGGQPGLTLENNHPVFPRTDWYDPITGVVDNFGTMVFTGDNSNRPNAIRHFVVGDPAVNINDASTGIDMSGVQPIVQGQDLPDGSQYLRVFVNGEWRTLISEWREVEQLDVCIDHRGKLTGADCSARIFELRFAAHGIDDREDSDIIESNRWRFDGGRVAFSSNRDFHLPGASFTGVNNGRQYVPPLRYLDIPGQTQSVSGFNLAFEARIDLIPIVTGNPGMWMQTGANASQGFRVWTADARAGLLGITDNSQSVGRRFTGTSIDEHGNEVKNFEEVVAQANIRWVCDCFTLAGARATTRWHALRAIGTADVAIRQVSEFRTLVGVQMNRLEIAGNANRIMSENARGSESRIRDADMALEMKNVVMANVLQQAATSMLAQASQDPQAALQLLGQ